MHTNGMTFPDPTPFGKYNLKKRKKMDIGYTSP